MSPRSVWARGLNWEKFAYNKDDKRRVSKGLSWGFHVIMVYILKTINVMP